MNFLSIRRDNLAQPRHKGARGGTLVLLQEDDGTDLVDLLGKDLPSPKNRWEVGWGSGETRRRGGRTGMGFQNNKLI